MEGDSSQKLNKKRKFVQEGLFKAELRSFLESSLAQEGFSSIEVMSTNTQTKVYVCASQTEKVTGENDQRQRELAYLIRKRFNFTKDSFDLLVKKVFNIGLSAAVQAESLKFNLANGIPVRLAANRVIRTVMRHGAKGIEVAVSGKLRQQRAKTMKFKEGYLISTGRPKQMFIDEAVRHVLLKQGILGIKVKIMLGHDPAGTTGPKHPLPDIVEIIEPKSEGFDY